MKFACALFVCVLFVTGCGPSATDENTPPGTNTPSTNAEPSAASPSATTPAPAATNTAASATPATPRATNAPPPPAPATNRLAAIRDTNRLAAAATNSQRRSPPPLPMPTVPQPQAIPQASTPQPPPAARDLVVIETTEGAMTFELWPDVAPKTVESFKKLAQQDFYDGTAFHRIVKGFMVQGGDPLTKDPAQEERWGTGGPGYNLPAEFNPRSHVRGVLSMARGPNPNSAGSQFFIVLDPAPHLDRQYTAFGKLVEGENILVKIGETPVTANRQGEMSKPTRRIEIKDVRLLAPAAGAGD